jgi:SAM-dependent methyltransferase
LEGFRVIDPACGSGHLLLDAFWRVFLARTDPEEGPAEMLADTAARLAVTAIHGVDLNPEVVEITRLRLALAYCDAARISVERLPALPALPLRVEAGDSLLLGRVHPSPPPLRPVPVPVQLELELLSRVISSRSEVAL